MKSESPEPDSGLNAIRRRAQFVIAACERYSKGGNRDQGIWFFRGMAVQELDDAVRTGRFHGQGNPIHGTEGDIWAAPATTRIKSRFMAGRGDPNGESWDTIKDAQDTARRYAATRATMLTLMEAVGVRERNSDIYYLMMELDWGREQDPPIQSQLARLYDGGSYVKEIDELTQKFGSRAALARTLEGVITSNPKGVVIGIHKDVLDDVTDIGIEDDGVRIGVGERKLRLEDIRTIQILGEDGERYLESLKKLVG